MARPDGLLDLALEGKGDGRVEVGLPERLLGHRDWKRGPRGRGGGEGGGRGFGGGQAGRGGVFRRDLCVDGFSLSSVMRHRSESLRVPRKLPSRAVEKEREICLRCTEARQDSGKGTIPLPERSKAYIESHLSHIYCFLFTGPCFLGLKQDYRIAMGCLS